MSCDYCQDRAPADGSYYRCRKCDAEWSEEVIKLKPLKWSKIGDNTFSAQNGLGVFKVYENILGTITLDDGQSFSTHSSIKVAQKEADKECVRRVVEELEDSFYENLLRRVIP